MKLFEKVACLDLEANGLTPDRIWVLSVQEIVNGVPTRDFSLTDYNDMREFLTTYDGYILAHNGIGYDIPVLERLLDIKIKGTPIDTLALSWYLEPKRIKHGLEGYGEDFGVPKPVIIDWDDPELLPEYIHRCEEDVKIQTRLWRQQLKHLNLLYEDKTQMLDCILYLTSKMKAVQIASKGWKLNVPDCEKLFSELTETTARAKVELEKGMPQVPVIAKKSRPKKPFKKDGSLSATGIKWDELVKEHGKDFNYEEVIEIVSSYKEPNAGSHTQIKSWLTDLGWKPQTFKYVRKEGDRHPRAIPQVKKDDELCPSVLRLASKDPAIKHLETLGMLNHRKAMVGGFLKNQVDGRLSAKMSGFTNTLRLKHKELVNLPSTRKPYGEQIRGLLISEEGNCLLGSDMVALESMIAQHYCMPLDPEYVKSLQTEGYDPHLNIAEVANMMSADEVEFYKWYKSK